MICGQRRDAQSSATSSTFTFRNAASVRVSKIVVVALRQAGDGDRADARAATGEADRKAPAMRHVVVVLQAVLLLHRAPVALKLEADRVGAAMEAERDVALAPHPFGIVGRGPAMACEKSV